MLRDRWHVGAQARRRTIGTLVAASLLATSAGVMALTAPSSADISTPAQGAVIRDAGPVTITEARGGRYADDDAATTQAGTVFVVFTRFGCNGAGPNGATLRPKANTRIRVIRESDGVEMVNAFYETPNKSPLEGGANAANALAPFTTTWDTTGAEPGLYRVISTTNDRDKVNNQNGSTSSCTPDQNTVRSNFLVEYRPWQHSNFNDLLGQGNVRMNSNPRELQYSITGTSSPVITGTPQSMSFYSGPTGLLELPGDPESCATDPLGCLPADAVACDPSAGCVPSLALVNYQDGGEYLLGIFDLESGAFVASASVGGKRTILQSAGTDLDAALLDAIEQLAILAEDQGIDLISLLNTKLEIRMTNGNEHRLEISVLESLKLLEGWRPDSTGVGYSLLAPFVLNAGFSTHVVDPFCHAGPTNGTCQFIAGLFELGTLPSGAPEVINVTESALVPEIPVPLLPVPLPPPANVLGTTITVAGGPLVNLQHVYPDGTGSHTVGSGLTGPSVDTTRDEPAGLPVWAPLIDQNMTVPDAGPLDFLGHAVVIDLPLIPDINLDLGSIVVGQGLWLYGDGPVGFAGLPLLWDTENPAAAELNELLGTLAPEVLDNEAVGAVLAAALGLAGGGTPDLDEIAAILSDFGTFTELIEAVAGAGGIEAVPGLEETLGILSLEELLGVLDPVVDPILALLGSAGP